MSNYRRHYQPGAHYFFTLVSHQRQPIFSTIENVNRFKNALNKVKLKYPFSLNAIVILPDHLHCLWKLPENDKDFSKRWRLIKRYFSMQINVAINPHKEKGIWQRRFWEHTIRDEKDWESHMDYIHYNPVKHGLVNSPKDWPYSSFAYWVEKEVYKKNWGSGEDIIFSGIHEAE